MKKASERISVPKVYHPFILGAHSENLSAMIAETGAKINVPPPSVMKDEIVIAGEKEGVLAAKAKIEAIYQQMVNMIKHELDYLFLLCTFFQFIQYSILRLMKHYLKLRHTIIYVICLSYFKSPFLLVLFLLNITFNIHLYIYIYSKIFRLNKF